jgi:hypothetical protein
MPFLERMMGAGSDGRGGKAVAEAVFARTKRAALTKYFTSRSIKTSTYIYILYE